jgi:hypothetical protein
VNPGTKNHPSFVRNLTTSDNGIFVEYAEKILVAFFSYSIAFQVFSGNIDFESVIACS